MALPIPNLDDRRYVLPSDQRGERGHRMALWEARERRRGLRGRPGGQGSRAHTGSASFRRRPDHWAARPARSGSASKRAFPGLLVRPPDPGRRRVIQRNGNGSLPGHGRASVKSLLSPHPLGGYVPALYQGDPFAQAWLSALDTVLAPIFSSIDNFDAYSTRGWRLPTFSTGWRPGWDSSPTRPGLCNVVAPSFRAPVSCTACAAPPKGLPRTCRSSAAARSRSSSTAPARGQARMARRCLAQRASTSWFVSRCRTLRRSTLRRSTPSSPRESPPISPTRSRSCQRRRRHDGLGRRPGWRKLRRPSRPTTSRRRQNLTGRRLTGRRTEERRLMGRRLLSRRSGGLRHQDRRPDPDQCAAAGGGAAAGCARATDGFEHRRSHRRLGRVSPGRRAAALNSKSADVYGAALRHAGNRDDPDHPGAFDLTTTTPNGKPLLLKGQTFQAIFQVQSPAMMPTPAGPQPDPLMVKMGTAQFITTNSTVTAS
jgi:Contractile injection system spike tip protein